MKQVTIQRYAGTEIIEDKSLLDQLLSLDKLNMIPIMEASGITTFPWEKRIKGLNTPSTQIIAAIIEKNIIGYLEFCKDWDNQDDIYISSIQILPQHQGTTVFKRLFKKAYSELKSIDHNLIRSNVQKTNLRMINIFKRIGFEITDQPEKKSLSVTGHLSDLCQNHIVRKLIN